MRKILLIIISIIAISLGGYSFYLNNQLNSKMIENKELNSKLEEQIHENENMKNSLDVIENTISAGKSNNKVSEDKISIDKFAVYNKGENISYVKLSEERPKLEEYGVSIDIKDKNAYITIDDKNERIKSVNEDFKGIKNEKISGFSKVPVSYFLGIFGNGLGDETIFFLMEDNSVEYVKLFDIVENNKCKVTGKISELKNIKEFDILDVSDDMSGYITTVAINQDGKIYDIYELIK